jgi:hypothetical protein
MEGVSNMTKTALSLEEQAVHDLLWQVTGLKLPGVGGNGYGARQMAAKQKLEEHYKAAIDAAYQRGWNDREADFKARLGLE